MPHPKQIINPLSSERLKILLGELKITQNDLANRIYVTQQTISKIVNQKAPLTQKNAELIEKEFPPYRAAWLLGLDDFKTKAELFLRPLAESTAEHDIMFSALSLLGQINGFSIVPPDISSSDAVSVIKSRKSGYSICKGNRTIHISLEDMNNLEVLIADFVKLQLDYLFKQKGDTHG